MITKTQLTEIGQINQPHGIKGEVNAILFDGVDLNDLSCIVLDMDGIFVPFFLSGVRQRGSQSYLIVIDGIENEQKAITISNKTIYALTDELKAFENLNEEGFYAEDFIGFTISTKDKTLNGTITDIEDSTENVLFIVDADNGKTHLIPVADELITDIDIEKHCIIVDLPVGLLEL